MATIPTTPTMGAGLAHPDGPPASLKDSNFELYNYLQMIHSHIFGLGGDTGDLDAFHKIGTHELVSQGIKVSEISATVTASVISVDSADATNASETSQVTLENELKGDVNNLITEYNTAIATLSGFKTNFNALLTSLRTAKVIAT